MAVATATALSVAALASAGVSAYAQNEAGRMQQKQANYNATLAENQALAERQKIAAEQSKLARQQREQRGRAAASIASRGGMMGGTDLLALAELAKNQSVDQLELTRQSGIARDQGIAEARAQRFAGKTARYTSRLGAASSLVSGLSSAYNAQALYGTGDSFLGMELPK